MSDTVKTIPFNPEAIKLLNHLSKINPSIIIDKVFVEEEEEAVAIEVKSSDTSGSLLYHWKSPADGFNFKDNDIAFHRFGVFADSVEFVESPVIEQSNQSIITIRGNTNTIENSITDPRYISGTWPDHINETTIFEDENTVFELSGSVIKEVLKAQSKIIGNDENNLINLFAKDESLRFKLTTKNHSNTYDDVLGEASSLDDNLDISFYSSFLSVIPTIDYTVSVNEQMIRLVANDLVDDMELTFYMLAVVD